MTKEQIEKLRGRGQSLTLKEKAELFDEIARLRAVCQTIRDHFAYFSEWDLPLTFEDDLNAALGVLRQEREG